MKNPTQDLVLLAKAFHPHGIKGEVELRLLNHHHEESVLHEGLRVWLFPASPKSQLKNSGEAWSIERLRFGQKVICLLSGIKDRTHLETLLPFEVKLPREEFPPEEEHEFYLVDLIGGKVISPEGNELGELEGVSDNGAQYLFEVRLNTGGIMTLPYVQHFFPKVDKTSKTITMVLPEYTE
jgi:16S rRNA processing protein RimM